MNSAYILLALIVFISSALGQLSQEFDNPPVKYRPKFRYWLPDASIASEVVAEDIRSVLHAGAGGLELVPFYLSGRGEESFGRDGAGPVPRLPDWSKYGFGTPSFVKLLGYILTAARDNGITIDYALGANQGQGVPSQVTTPGLAVELQMGWATVAPGEVFDAKVPQAEQASYSISNPLYFTHPTERFGTPNLTATIAYQVETSAESGSVALKKSSFIDLGSLVRSNKTLRWSPTDNKSTWRIFTFWESYTNQRSCDGGPDATEFLGNGSWVVDHFSKNGAAKITEFWDQYILSNDRIANLLRTTGKYVWEDDMKILAALYWTPGLLQQFKRNNGYDLQPYLPLLFNPSNTIKGSSRVYKETFIFGNYTSEDESFYQLDYRNALNEGYQEYLKHFQEWTHSIGNQYSTQPAYNLPLQALSDISFVDAPEGESLGFLELVDVYRQFVGPAHLTNKKVISTEVGAANVPPYSLTIPNLLQKIKRSFAGGFTMGVIHGYPSLAPYVNTTWPGYTPFFYNYTEMWNPIQPAWQHLEDSLDFVGRNQWVLQQGQPKVDLVIYAYAAPWSAITRYESDRLRHWGYTYDYLGPDNLVSSDAFVNNKRLGVPEYKAVIFNNQKVSTVGAIEALEKFAAQGLKIVFIGPPPNKSYPGSERDQARFETAVRRLITAPNVYHTSSIDEIPSLLRENGIVPRISIGCTPSALYTVYRSSAETDYVYIYNDQNVSPKCGLNIDAVGVVPYIYDAWTGSQTPLLQYTSTETQVSIIPTMKANETLILTLHRKVPQPICTVAQWSSYIRSVAPLGKNLQVVLTYSPYILSTSTGKVLRFNAAIPSPTNLTTWQLTIEDWHSAPDRFAIENKITNHTFNNASLVPWSQISAALRPVSGIGHYTATFGPPSDANFTSLVGYINLPPTQHTARVYLDGKWLGPIDPVNPVLPLKGLEKDKLYELRIDVSTTLFNRVKAEADSIWMVGQVASKVTTKYSTAPYEEYGLVGSVSIDWGYMVDVEC